MADHFKTTVGLRDAGRILALALALVFSTNTRAEEAIEEIPLPPPAAVAPQSAPEAPDALGDFIATVQDPNYKPPPQTPPNLFGSIALPSGGSGAEMQARWLDRLAWPPAGGPWSGLLQRIRYLPRDEQMSAVNSWVNHTLAIGDDRDIYGLTDHWASIEESFARGRGDCEDFAIAKMQLLQASGFSREDLYLAILKDEIRHVDHAVLAVREGDDFWILDSQTDKLVRSEYVRGYRPIATYSAGHAWVHGFRSQAALPGATPP